MKYLVYVRSKQFTQALACLSPKMRYLTVKHRWYALRLGLYRTVLGHSMRFIVRSQRNKVVTTIAAIKRQSLNEYHAQAAIAHILSHKCYYKFHVELIKETVTAYPNVILTFLEKSPKNLETAYHQGLYLALLHQYHPESARLKEDIDKFLLGSVQVDYVDRYCLYNNITLTATRSKLTHLNQVLAYYKLAGIYISEDKEAFSVTNLRSSSPQSINRAAKQDNAIPKVTIIVTTYNASVTINSCIDSLMQQSWANLEVIVVDDASTDDTLLQLKYLCQQYRMLKVIALPKNTGTFAAKSIGAKYATGVFLTCQDSDDWAHPQKIAEQVQPLIKDADLIATTSFWLRLDHNGQYYVRQLYPFMRQNPASPMFRLSKIKKDIGLWHIVRTGADSEFYERLRLVYGKDRIKVIKKPLTIASHRPNSLMTSKEFGIYNKPAALARLDYWEAWRLWHIDSLYKKQNIFMPEVQQQANSISAQFINIPDSIRVDKTNLNQNLANHKVLNID